MFRGKESSNRIELSRLVQELLKFGVLGSLRLLGRGQVGGGYGGGRWSGGCPLHGGTCTRTHARARMHTHVWYTCIEFMQMAASIGGIPCLACPYACHNMHVRACVRACTCMCAWDAPPTHPYLPPPLSTYPAIPPGGWTPGIIQNSIVLKLIEIFQFCLKI